MANKEKKGCSGCFKFVLILLAIYIGASALIVGVGPVGEKNRSTDVSPTATASSPIQTPTATPTAKPTATPTASPTTSSTPLITPEPTEEPAAAPVITGSQAYDFILSLKERGIAKPDTKTTSWGYEWISDSALVDDSLAMYSIRSNRKHEIAYVSITVRGDAANWLLPFCATLPYENNDPQAAHKWVEEHLTGEDASTQIGNAVYGIYPHENGTGAMLTIEAAGYQDWCLDQIK